MSTYVLYAKSGARLTDEMFLKALDTLTTPLFSPSDMTALQIELDTRTPRKRGRPSGLSPNRFTLAATLSSIERDDLPIEVKSALVDRLESGERYCELQRAYPFHRARQKSNREMLICGLYHDIYALLGKPGPIANDLLGELTPPPDADSYSKSELALVMTQNVLRDRLRMNPPSIGRLRNIVSSKFREKT